MSIEIKTATLEPVRNTFAHVQRRFGDKPATRYQEATYDVMATDNFHYKPMWGQEHQLNDPSRTAIVMQDWYAFKDPRQFYYGTYVQTRARMQEVTENNYAFFDKRGLAARIPEQIQQLLINYLVPLRHVEHTANLNNVLGTSQGFGTAITQALLYNGMDRLGIAQYLSRIGLLLDGNTGQSLEQAKSMWMQDEAWQGMRALCEQTLTVKDWFEVLVAQDLVMDCLVYDLYYRQFDAWLSDNNGGDAIILIDFMQNWFKETSRWLDSVIKIAAAESAENQQQLKVWVDDWQDKTVTALSPLADKLLPSGALNESVGVLEKRLLKIGLSK